MECIYWHNLGAGTPPQIYQMPIDCGDYGSGSDSGGNNGGSSGGGGGGYNTPPPGNGGPPINLSPIECIVNLDCEDCGLPGDLNGDCTITYDEGRFNLFLQNLNGLQLSTFNNLNENGKTDVLNYLIANDFSERAKSFAMSAIDAWADAGEVNFEDEIINSLEGKALCIYNKLLSSSTGFKNAIKKFDGEFPVSHLSFKINNTLPSGNYGITKPPNNFNTTVEFSNTQLSNISDLGGAVAFAHEMIHAEIFRKMLSAAQKGNLDPANMTQQEQVAYVNSLRNNFPGIYDYYIERYKPTWNHNQMASHYRETIADIIEEFDDSSKSRQIYEDLSWVGLRILENGVTSIAWDVLTQSEKDRVLSNFNTHFFNGTSNCN